MSQPIVQTLTYSDAYPYRMTTWPASAPLRARLLILHGVQSHAGWYENLGRVLASRGYEAHFPDRRGSGANQVDRGHTPSARRLVVDVEEALARLRNENPTLPVGLAGISWGGKLAMSAAGSSPNLAEAVALICPGLMPRVGVSRGERLRIALAYFITGRRKLFPIPLSDPALFTANPEGQAFIAADPHALRTATASLLASSTILDYIVRKSLPKVRQPVLLMLAGHDRIVDNEKTLTLCRELGTKDLRTIEYPEGHHTLEFDPDPDRYADDLASWFDEALPRT